jgi:EAL domain-containing protein (putative c-di-GMP-specific phosphodiesterase class I)
MALTLHVQVVAEGIEREEQRDELWSLGCLLGQGYLYSEPVSADKISAMLVAQQRLGPCAGHPGHALPHVSATR